MSDSPYLTVQTLAERRSAPTVPGRHIVRLVECDIARPQNFWGSGRRLKLRVFGIHRYRGGSGVTTNVIRRLDQPLDCCTTALSTPQMRDGERRQFAEGLIAGSVSLESLGYIFEAHRYEDLYLGSAIHALLPLTRPIRPPLDGFYKQRQCDGQANIRFLQ